MIKRLLSLVLCIVVFSCSNNSFNDISKLEFKTYTIVVTEVPEVQVRLQKLLGNDYEIINSLLVKSNPGLSPIVDGYLFSFFADNANYDQVYMLIDNSNNNILLGYYNATEDKVRVFEEKEGATYDGEFDKWVNGE